MLTGDEYDVWGAFDLPDFVGATAATDFLEKGDAAPRPSVCTEAASVTQQARHDQLEHARTRLRALATDIRCNGVKDFGDYVLFSQVRLRNNTGRRP